MQIPTFNQLYSGVLSDLQNEFGINISLTAKVALRVIAFVQASKLKLFYYSLGKVQKNVFVDTAEPEASGGTLERFGRVKLGRNPFGATAGQYRVQFTGTVGAIVPASTTFKSNDDSLNPGKLFVLDSAFELGPTIPFRRATIRALEAGLDSKLNAPGDTLTSTAPINGVNRVVTVVSETVAPLAAEDLETYRQRAIDAYQLEPQGGSASDYRLWAADAQGVQQVYPYAKSGGEINLFVEATSEDAEDGYAVPTDAILEAVESVIELDPDDTKPANERGRKPLQATVNCLPVTVKQVVIRISDYQNPTAEKSGLIEAALQEEINAIRPFVAAVDALEDRNDFLDKNRVVSIILQAVSGSVFGDVVIEIDSIEESSFTFENGDIPKFIEAEFV